MLSQIEIELKSAQLAASRSDCAANPPRSAMDS